MRPAPMQLRTRVERSLQRLGMEEIQVAVDNDGNIILSGTLDSFDDRALVVAATKTVAGVVSVTSHLK